MKFFMIVSPCSKRNLFLIIFFFISGFVGFSQQARIDSLMQILENEKTDSIRLKLIDRIFYSYLWTDIDSALYYADRGLTLSRKNKNKYYEGLYLQNTSQALALLGNAQGAIKYAHNALRIAEELNNSLLSAKCFNALASTYEELKDFQEAIKYCRKSRDIGIKMGNRRSIVAESANLASLYNSLNQLDSAINYAQEAYKLALEYDKWDIDMVGSILIRLGVIQRKLGNYEISLAYLKKAVASSLSFENWVDYYDANFEIGKIFSTLNQKDSCIIYYNLAFEGAQKIKYKRGMLEVSSALATIYIDINKDSTLTYLQVASALKDSLFNEEKLRTVQNMLYAEKEYEKELENEKATVEKERKQNLQFMGITIFILTLFIFLILAFKGSR